MTIFEIYVLCFTTYSITSYISAHFGPGDWISTLSMVVNILALNVNIFASVYFTENIVVIIETLLLHFVLSCISYVVSCLVTIKIYLYYQERE